MPPSQEHSHPATQPARSGEPSGARPFAPSKTAFLIVNSGAAIRCILRSDTFTVLKAHPGLRLVIFSPLTDEGFRREFEAENVVVEPLPHWKGNLVTHFVRSLKKDIWAGQTDLFTFKSKRTRKDGRFLRSLVLRLLKREHSPERAQSLLRWLDHLEERFTPLQAPGLFDRYRPDLVFYTTLYSRTHCLEIGAQQRGIRSVAFVLSWDNPTSKGPFPVKPDRLILWNEILREEIIQHHGFRPEQLYVSGAPQFDIYARSSEYRSRLQFFKKWNLDPAKKLLAYTTGTPGTSPFDHEVVELLYQAVKGGAFRQPCQLLVRLHPKDIYSDYKRFENQPDLVLQLPGRRGDTEDSWNPTHDDMFSLAELMFHADVVINVASTITIDASAFDTPVVNVAFDGFKTRPFENSCLRYYQYEHYRRIVKTGGVKVVKSMSELVQATQRYLDNPDEDAEGRQRIRVEQCWRLDGLSGARVANHLISLLE